MIDQERGRVPVRTLCQALGVSASAYYDWRRRSPSAREVEDRRLAVEVRAVHRESPPHHGGVADLRRPPHPRRAPRSRGGVRAAPGRPAHARGRARRSGAEAEAAEGHARGAAHAGGRERARPGVRARGPRPRLGRRHHAYLDRRGVALPRRRRTVAGPFDLFSRRVVGWAVRPSLHRELAVAALTAALRDRRPAPGLVCHSDQGTQYTSSEYRALLRRHEVVCSMSRRGNCHDNAPEGPVSVPESLFGSLKTECVRGERFGTHAEARAALFDYLAFYNHRRRHSALGYLRPTEYERRHHEQQAMSLAA